MVAGDGEGTAVNDGRVFCDDGRAANTRTICAIVGRSGWDFQKL